MKLGDPQEIGKLMRERRVALGFTQQQFAEATGVSPITIMRIELGRVGYIHAKTAKALEVPRKIVKRMVMVPTPVDGMGRELATPHAPVEHTSGDSTVVGIVMPSYQSKLVRARKAKLEANKANVEQLHGEAHVASPLKKLFLWMAAKV